MHHCDDCNLDYSITDREHRLICEARTCMVCLTTFAAVIPEDRIGMRVCQDCKTEWDGEFDLTSEEEDEDGAT